MGVPAQPTVDASLEAGCRQTLNSNPLPAKIGDGGTLTTLGLLRRALSAEAIEFRGAVAQVSAGHVTAKTTQVVGGIAGVIPTSLTDCDQLAFM